MLSYTESATALSDNSVITNIFFELFSELLSSYTSILVCKFHSFFKYNT